MGKKGKKRDEGKSICIVMGRENNDGKRKARMGG